MRQKMALWCLILILTLSKVALRIHSQPPSTKGFISIDCGISSNANYIDSFTGLTYVSDHQYIDTGFNYNISSVYTNVKQLSTLRSFPNFTKNCYTLSPVIKGNTYLVRATFLYGNYDNLNRFPTFNIYLGVNYWCKVDIKLPNYFYYHEIIATASDDYIQVCLINTGLGTPFISALELRPLAINLRGNVNFNQALDLYFRLNMGSSNNIFVRYPDDPYDRLWPNFTSKSWTEKNTTSLISTDPIFETPSTVLQTAVIPSKVNSLNFSWSSTDPSTIFFVVLHISEIEVLASTDYRGFDIYATGEYKYEFVPYYLSSGWAFYKQTGFIEYNVSLKSTANSTLPPILNAIEVYKIKTVLLSPTDTKDVIAINAIKGNYSVNKGWNGDPCVPTNLSWTGVNCTLTSSDVSQITDLNLTSSGLTGEIISAFGDLTSLKSLDLSRNKLSGSIPSSLNQLTALTFLDLSGNTNLSTTLPPALQIRKDNGLLIVKITDVSNPCEGSGCGKKKSPVIIIVIVVVVVLILFFAVIAALLFYKKKGQNQITINTQHNVHHGTTPLRNDAHGNQDNKLYFESHQFTFSELQIITNNFQNNIGTGGFGSVFRGCLENGKQVAVKLRSDKSSQGFDEFMAEVKNLTRIHHKNLVSLMGYCMEGEYMALIYEYMSEGTLQDKLRDNARPLAWKQRLRIAHESAQGLEYLHKSCSPPLVHRDVKTNNILLTANLEAKITDFGLVRAFDGDGTKTHVSTRIVGTPGYLDPDYYTTSQLSEKSDVYSFGVVLLEVVTGQPPIIAGPQGGHLALLVRQKLSKGNIESIIDQRMGNQFDINSLWKVAELGLKCTDQTTKRPTMTSVVAELKESLDLGMSYEKTYSVDSGSTNQYNYLKNDNFSNDVSNDTGFEMAYDRVSDASGPSAR